ncbi:MAG: AraC family transcriptional regulator [Spirochaetaceae bacterium]
MSKLKGITPTYTAPNVTVHQNRCPIEKFSGAWFLKIPKEVTTVTFTPPGHLLHYIIKGEYVVLIEGREYKVKQGDIIYYYGVEEVAAINKAEAVEFYSISFHAPDLNFNTGDNRVFHDQKFMKPLFETIYTNNNMPGLHSLITIFDNLFQIIGNLIIKETMLIQQHTHSELWDRVERYIKENRMFRLSITELSEWGGVSASSLHRSCINHCGVSPGKRMKMLRMAEAKGLIQFTELSISEISIELGYERPHELSREVKHFFGESPMRLRQSI